MPEIICPHCQNPIYDEDALLCHFCGESLERSSGMGSGMMRVMQWLIIVIAIILILMFVLPRV